MPLLCRKIAVFSQKGGNLIKMFYKWGNFLQISVGNIVRKLNPATSPPAPLTA
jgi:hypothetical protein